IQVTPAGPFVTYNFGINLAPGTTTSPTFGMVNGTCIVPENPDHSVPSFYVVSMRTYKQGVHTFVKDGTPTTGTMVFDSTSWDQPGARNWNSTPFFPFTTGMLTYQCEYLNPNNRTIVDGDSPATDEMCMTVGYYFPAVGGTGHLCLDSGLAY